MVSGARPRQSTGRAGGRHSRAACLILRALALGNGEPNMHVRFFSSDLLMTKELPVLNRTCMFGSAGSFQKLKPLIIHSDPRGQENGISRQGLFVLSNSTG